MSRTPTSDAASKPVRTVSISAEDPVSVAHRPPSPARRPQSNVVHMTGLVRPFTVGQLKELLGRTGTLVDDGFWIDSIKSHCYVVVRTTLRLLNCINPSAQNRICYVHFHGTASCSPFCLDSVNVECCEHVLV